MTDISEDIIRETFSSLAKAIGVQIDIPDEMIANLAATLQSEIDRLEAVETESFEFLNELALAFRAAENHPRPQYAPILEGVRAVLAHLTATGRLVPTGGMALTAELVEDVRKMLDWVQFHAPLGKDGRDLRAAYDRLREGGFGSVPATEPTSYCSKGVCSANEGHDGTCAEASGWAHDAYEDAPAPAVPAEEETKAERDSQGIIRINGGRIVALSRDPRELVQQWYDLAEPGSKWQRDYAAALDLFDREAASSPVVPAPTETGPWHDISEAPKHLTLIDRVGDKWTYDGDNWVTPETAILPVLYINRKYAPFVAVKEQ